MAQTGQLIAALAASGNPSQTTYNVNKTDKHESSLDRSHPLHRTRAVLSQGSRVPSACPIEALSRHRVNSVRLS